MINRLTFNRFVDRYGKKFSSALFNAKQLSDLYDFTIELKLNEEGVLSIETELDSALSDRILDLINQNIVDGDSLVFNSLDSKSKYSLEVYKEKPINRLSSLVSRIKGNMIEVNISDSTSSKLDRILARSRPEVETKSISSVLDNMLEEVKLDVEKLEVKSESISFIEEKFNKMEEDKLSELKERLDKLSFDKTNLLKKLDGLTNEIELLNSRISSMSKGLDLNGYVFNVSQSVIDKDLDSETKVVVDRISKVMGIEPRHLYKALLNNVFTIRIAKSDNLNVLVTDEVLDLLNDIKVEKVSDSFEYKGDLPWGMIVNKLIKLGFGQSSDFDNNFKK